VNKLTNDIHYTHKTSTVITILSDSKNFIYYNTFILHNKHYNAIIYLL